MTFYSQRKALSVRNDSEVIKVLNNIDKYLTKAPSAFILCPMMSSKGKVLPDEHNIEATKKLIRTNFSEYNNSQLFLDCEVISK